MRRLHRNDQNEKNEFGNNTLAMPPPPFKKTTASDTPRHPPTRPLTHGRGVGPRLNRPRLAPVLVADHRAVDNAQPYRCRALAPGRRSAPGKGLTSTAHIPACQLPCAILSPPPLSPKSIHTPPHKDRLTHWRSGDMASVASSSFPYLLTTIGVNPRQPWKRNSGGGCARDATSGTKRISRWGGDRCAT